jgi:homoserine dehydrogenase
LSFEDFSFIPRERFEWIEEWHVCEARKYLVGVISISELRKDNWWKENDTSLILLPESIMEETATRKLKKRSLELAGIL